MTSNYELLRDRLGDPHTISILQHVALPHGGEFRDGCAIDIATSTPERIVIKLDYLHEDPDTGRTEPRPHLAVVTPDPIGTCHVAITGPDLYDQNDVISEVIWYGLCQCASLVEDLVRKAAAYQHLPFTL